MLVIIIIIGFLINGCANHQTILPGDEVLGLDPQGSPAELYVRMAEEYYHRNQLEIAFRRAQQALAADHKYPRAHVWLAFLYEKFGQITKAREHYEQAITLSPNNADIHNAYGSFQCRQQHLAEAQIQFAKALASPLYSTPWIALTNSGDCANEAGDSKKAEEQYRAAIALKANYGPVLVKLAELSHRQGDIKTAKMYIDRYFAAESTHTPESAYLALNLGISIERALGNRKQADYYATLLNTNFPNVPTTRPLKEVKSP